MIGTIALIALAVFGFMHVTPWVIIPAALINGFIGLHFPAHKAMMLRERGVYWSVYFQSLPLQAAFAGIVYGVGYGISLLAKLF